MNLRWSCGEVCSRTPIKGTVNQQQSGRNTSRVYFLDVLNTLKGPIQRMEIEKREETIANGATGKTFGSTRQRSDSGKCNIDTIVCFMPAL